MTHEKRIEIRWRDCNAYRHVSNAVYATYLEECRDEWIESALGDAGDPWDYVLARVAIDFRRELTQDDDTVLVRSRPERLGMSSLTLREEIRTADGELSAEAEAVLVARERETGTDAHGRCAPTSARRSNVLSALGRASRAASPGSRGGRG